MKVLVYVNTSKEVGDVDHIKVFAGVDAMEKWFAENDPEGWRLSIRFWKRQTAHQPARVRRAKVYKDCSLSLSERLCAIVAA